MTCGRNLKPENDDIINLFSYVKRNLNHLSVDRLLEKIYTAHPEMLENSISKIADKIRAKEPSQT
jgi:hypothetical protein